MRIEDKERKFIAVRNVTFFIRKDAFHTFGIVIHQRAKSHYVLFFDYPWRIYTLVKPALCLLKWKQKPNWNNPMHTGIF